MNSTPGFGDSYYKHSSRSESLHSPSSPAHTSYSYDQPQISGEVILEEIPAAISRPGSSLNQSKRKEPAPNVSFSKGGGSPTQPRRWRLIPATCTCPVHSSSQDYSVGNSSSFVSDEDSFRFSRYSSSRSRVLDEELDRLKGTVHQLENDVMQNKGPRRLSPKSSTLPAPSRSSFRERTEIESTRKELESELKGWHGKLLEQMEGLKKRLGEEMSTRSSHEHELLTKNSHIERLQHQLEDAMKKLHIADEKIIDLKTSKSKLKDKLGDAVAELRDIPQKRAADESKFSDEMRRILENEMDVRIKVETELHNLQKLVEKEMGESANVKKLLEARTRELEETRNANSRLERDLHMLKNSVEKEKSHYSREVDQRELDCQELRDQLNLVTNQLEKEREHHLEQMREKIQELNNLQQELQRLKKRVAELESMLEKASQKNQQLDGDRSKIAELESVKTRLETEISQLQNKLRTVDKDRERMVAAIYDLQSQVDNLQNRSDSPDQEHNRAATMIRELQAQVEDLRIKYAEEHEHSSKLVGEVDETNLALDEVRLGLEKEMELKKEAERENGVLQRMFEDEVNQWRAREAEWEAERAELKDSNVNSFEYLTKIEKLEKAVEQLEQDLEDRNRELEEREAIIDELRENGARDSDKEEDKPKTDFEERMKMQVEGFQEQVKDLCIQLEEAHQKLDKESKAKADVETSKRRLEKALLELNAKLQATPTKASRDAEAQITSLKDQLAQVEDELNRSRAESRDDIEDFEFDPDLMEYDDEEIIESDEKVRVKLTDIQRVLRQLHKSLHQEQESTRRAREAEDANEEYHEWPNGHTGEQPEEEEGEGETIEDEDDEEQVPEELKEEPEEDEEQEPEQEEGLEQEEQEQEQEPEPEPEPEQEEGLEQEATLGEGQGELELEPLEAPLTPNGSKHVHFFGTPSPPATPPQTSPLQSPKTPSYPTSPTSPRSPRLPANEAEKERLANEWQRKVASSANKYTSSRIPLSSTKRLFSDSNKSSNENLKTKFEGLKKLVDSTPGEPKQPSTPSGKAPGFYYVPTQSDEIDEKLSKLVEQSDSSALGNIPTNFSRLEEGVYQFGTKKLHMCIRNGALVVRVGGGYMLFVDYLANDKYAKAENVRFRREEERKRFKTPQKEEPPREIPKHNDTIKMGTVVRSGAKLKLVTN